MKDYSNSVKLLLSSDVHKFKYSDLNSIEFDFSHDTLLYRINFNDTIINERYKNKKYVYIVLLMSIMSRRAKVSSLNKKKKHLY